MLLSDYCLPGVDPNLQDPLASRLLKLLEFYGGRLMILSGRRSLGEQQALYAAYLAGGNLAAKPGTSNHEKGLAADLERYDAALSWADVHAQANRVGLWFPVVGEDWHTEGITDWEEPPQPEEDMTLQELARAFGPKAVLGDDGVIRLPLINDTLDGTDLYPLGDCIVYIHQDEKMARLSK